MTTDTPQIRPLAMIAGLACVVTALSILLGPSLFRPAEWTQYHGITASVVFLTIAFLHLRAEAWASKRRMAACGFVALAVVGTFLIVGQSVGRQVEATETEALSAEKLNERLATKGGELTEAKGRLKYAEDRFEQESTGQKCLDRCNHWKRTADERRTFVKSIEAEIAALGPSKPVNAKAEAVADFLAIFGVDRKWTIGAYALLEPFAKTMLFEFGSVLSFGYAFPHSSRGANRLASGEPAGSRGAAEKAAERQAPAPADTEQSGFPALPNGPSAEIIALFNPDSPPNGPKGGMRKRPARKADVQADIVARRNRGERFGSQEDLRAALTERFGYVAKSSLSDWLGELDGVPRHQVGRCKAVG